jgi:hypothetical protein
MSPINKLSEALMRPLPSRPFLWEVARLLQEEFQVKSTKVNGMNEFTACSMIWALTDDLGGDFNKLKHHLLFKGIMLIR